MKFNKTILMIAIFLCSNLALSAEHHKPGWTGSKIENEVMQCNQTFSQDLCSLKKLSKVQEKLCTKSGLITFCGCLANVMGSLLSYREYRNAEAASKTMQSSGAFNRCLDDLMKSYH